MDEAKKIVQYAHAVADEHNAVVLLYSGSIDNQGFGRLMSALQPSETKPYKPNVVLLLTTRGGDANAAYRIARVLQQTFDRFVLVVPAICKSAGTLVALGANELVMDDVAELGPLDVQLMQRDEIAQRRSGMVVRTAFEGLATETFDVFERVMLGIKVKSFGTVSFDTASRIAANITSGVMSPIYAQISPDALGTDLRDLHVATQYGMRLARQSEIASPEVVDHLVSGYPSHDFIIDRTEASELFETVSSPDDNVRKLISSLAELVYTEHSPQVVLRLDENLGDKDDDANQDGQAADASPDMADGRVEEGRGDPEGS